MRKRILIVLSIIFVGLVVFFLYNKPSEKPPEREISLLLWDLEFLDLEKVTVKLPRENLSQTWTKGEDKQWYFDDGAMVSHDRWGGGVPLILSSPQASRFITAEATSNQLEQYGLDLPKMQLVLTAKDQNVNIDVGNATPTGQTYYIKLSGSSDVFTIDYTWFDIMERLVLEPPY